MVRLRITGAFGQCLFIAYKDRPSERTRVECLGVP